jgi:hypothetical protein
MTPSQLNRWAQRNYGLAYGQWVALVVLVTGYRAHGGLPMWGKAIDDVMLACEGRQSLRALNMLEALGLAERLEPVNLGDESPSCYTPWLPTPLALQLLPEFEPRPLAKAGELVCEEERKAG